MIGGYLDADMQYDQVSEKLAAYKYEKLPNSQIKRPVTECCSDDENDSDFDDETPLRHPDDNLVYKKVLKRVYKRLKFLTRPDYFISHYPLLLIEDAILVRRGDRFPNNRF